MQIVYEKKMQMHAREGFCRQSNKQKKMEMTELLLTFSWAGVADGAMQPPLPPTKTRADSRSRTR